MIVLLFCAAALILFVLLSFTLYRTFYEFIPAIKSNGLKKSLFKYKFSVAWTLINLSVLLGIYIQYKINEFDSAESGIPAKIHISRVISSGSEGLLGECKIVVSKLTDKTIHDIKTQGIKYFDGALTSRYQDETHQGGTYQKWNEFESMDVSSPSVENDSWFMCNQIDDKLAEKLRNSAKTSGGYMTHAPYTSLIVLPDLGVIVYTYNK